MPQFADRDANRSLKERLAQMQGSYERMRDGLGQLQQRMASLQVTAASSQDLVKVTVDARGQLQRLDLQPKAMRELNHVELANLILATVRKATAQALDEVTELLEPYSMGSSGAASFVRTGNYDDLLRRTDEAEGYRPPEQRG